MRKILFSCCFFICSFFSFSQECKDFKRLISEGDKYVSTKKYKEALNKYNAAKLCDATKNLQVDKLITNVFDAIENEKEEAIKQKKLAELALLEVDKQRIEATKSLIESMVQRKKATANLKISNALYWASEAEKIGPLQGLALIDTALKMSHDLKAITYCKEQALKIF